MTKHLKSGRLLIKIPDLTVVTVCAFTTEAPVASDTTVSSTIQLQMKPKTGAGADSCNFCREADALEEQSEDKRENRGFPERIGRVKNSLEIF